MAKVKRRLTAGEKIARVMLPCVTYANDAVCVWIPVAARAAFVRRYQDESPKELLKHLRKVLAAYIDRTIARHR